MSTSTFLSHVTRRVSSVVHLIRGSDGRVVLRVGYQAGPGYHDIATVTVEMRPSDLNPLIDDLLVERNRLVREGKLSGNEWQLVKERRNDNE